MKKMCTQNLLLLASYFISLRLLFVTLAATPFIPAAAVVVVVSSSSVLRPPWPASRRRDRGAAALVDRRRTIIAPPPDDVNKPGRAGRPSTPAHTSPSSHVCDHVALRLPSVVEHRRSSFPAHAPRKTRLLSSSALACRPSCVLSGNADCRTKTPETKTSFTPHSHSRYDVVVCDVSPFAMCVVHSVRGAPAPRTSLSANRRGGLTTKRSAGLPPCSMLPGAATTCVLARVAPSGLEHASDANTIPSRVARRARGQTSLLNAAAASRHISLTTPISRMGVLNSSTRTHARAPRPRTPSSASSSTTRI
mmetsp:Transcript_1743/g.6718  ORF Transcript_1743/g.6718 Transcript_1743/m.6718 type:complete len:307 (+) Transcript_1743:286-1206(+)